VKPKSRRTAPRSRRLAELTWREFRAAARRTDLVLLPVGTVEAHGVAALGTDNAVPESIAARIAEPLGALIAPTVNYGITKTLLPWPGSVTVSAETFERYVLEAASSIVDTGLRRVVFLNGHGGNTDALKNVCNRLWQDKRAFSMTIDWWQLCAEDVEAVYGHAGGHAGTDETALLSVDHPTDIRPAELRDTDAFLVRPGLYSVPFPGTIMLYRPGEGMPEFDPKKAERLMAAVCARITATVRDVLARWRGLDSD
jgi:creatinine amidohydrolase